MWRLNLTLVSILLCNLPVLLSQKKTVSLKLNYYQPYCGGARPSPEMQQEAEKPKEYANRMVIFVSEHGKVDSVKSTKNGLVKIKLKPGTYKLFEAWRYYKSNEVGQANSNYDLECLKSEWQKETFTITVNKKGFVAKEVNQIIFNCNWNRPCLKEENKQVPE